MNSESGLSVLYLHFLCIQFITLEGHSHYGHHLSGHLCGHVSSLYLLGLIRSGSLGDSIFTCQLGVLQQVLPSAATVCSLYYSGQASAVHDVGRQLVGAVVELYHACAIIYVDVFVLYVSIYERVGQLQLGRFCGLGSEELSYVLQGVLLGDIGCKVAGYRDNLQGLLVALVDILHYEARYVGLCVGAQCGGFSHAE